MGDAGLEVRGLEAGWDATAAVRAVDLDVGPGEIVAVLGGNGSGKSSLLWAIAGLLRPRAGTVRLRGVRADGLGADRIARLGVALLPQTRRVFPSLTVAENLAAPDLAPGPADADAPERRRQWLERFPALDAKRGATAASLSGGEQQLLAVGRVLSTAPTVLLLDEPSAGLSSGWTDECATAFSEIAAAGAAVVLVEQNTTLAHRLATRTLRMRDGYLSDQV